MTSIIPTYSPVFSALFASCFFEAQRRQNRHIKITDQLSSPTDSSWQISLPERLFGLSDLGLFSFDFFATSSPDQLVFADANHPTVKYGRMAPPSEDSVLVRLRVKYPKWLPSGGASACSKRGPTSTRGGRQTIRQCGRACGQQPRPHGCVRLDEPLAFHSNDDHRRCPCY